MKKFLLLVRRENKEENNLLYRRAIEDFGGEVVLVNDSDDWNVILNLLKDVSGILLPGGDDVGRYDYLLIEYAIKNKIKLLGICQGMQSMAMYGSCDKLISIGNESHYLKEKYCHDVEVNNNSKFYEIVKKKKFKVNSYHHQTVLKSHYFNVVGKSCDSLIEVIESNDGLQIGVQWHPERMFEYDDIAYKIIENFIKK